jgi:ketosteroid isomerase-like protein
MSKALLAACLLGVLTAGPADGRQAKHNRRLPNIEKEITTLEARRIKALTEADIAALEPIFADDLTYTHASGWTQNKSEFIETIRSGKLRYLSIEPANEQVRSYGTTVVGTGRAVVKVRLEGKEETLQLRFIEVYVKRRGRWQMVAWQSTRLTP